MYPFQRISDAGTLLVWRSSILISFWYKMYKRLTITVSGKLVMNHQPISHDILLHYGTTAVYNESTRGCKNPFKHLCQLYLITPILLSTL